MWMIPYYCYLQNRFYSQAFKRQIIFFDTATYPGRVHVIKRYSYVRKEISNNIMDSFIEEHYLFVYINIMKCFFSAKIGNWALSTVGIP